MALRAMQAEMTKPRPVGPVTAAILAMRAADPAFDTNPDLRALRRALADRIEGDIAALDILGGDDDLEDDELDDDAGDNREEENEHGSDDDAGEPSLCGLEVGPGDSWDREGGDIQDVPHDEDTDAEPSLCGLTVRSDDFHNPRVHLDGEHDAGDDRECENEHGIEHKPDEPRRPRVKLPVVKEYLLNVQGDCCAPVYPDGSQILCCTMAPRPGDFVAIHFKPDVAKRLGYEAWLKRLVFMCSPGGDIAPCVAVEQLNPPRSYVIPWADIETVHLVVGPKPADVRALKMTRAAKARFNRTWIRGVKPKSLGETAGLGPMLPLRR